DYSIIATRLQCQNECYGRRMRASTPPVIVFAFNLSREFPSMKNNVINFLSFVLVATSPLSALSQTAPQSSPQHSQKVAVSTAEVRLDVVVRDKKGHPVKDLNASDFEVYEDGVRQQVGS